MKDSNLIETMKPVAGFESNGFETSHEEPLNQLSPREFLLLFAERCPCHSDALPSCPLAALRSSANYAQSLAAMKDEEVQELYQHHLLCVAGFCGS